MTPPTFVCSTCGGPTLIDLPRGPEMCVHCDAERLDDGIGPDDWCGEDWCD